MDDFGKLEQVIRFASERHAVLASNIANADTPGFRAKDVKFDNVLDGEMKLAVTDEKHIGGSSPHVPGQSGDEPGNGWADGNNVEVDMEMAKMTENAMLFQAGLTMLSTKIRMFKTALRGK